MTSIDSNDIPIVSETTPTTDSSLQSVEHIKTIFDPSTCIQRGLCTVSKDIKRSPKPHNLYYELHGSKSTTATKIIFIMGLNNSSFAWHNQISYFAKLDYTVLVFDNRGVGNSDSPSGFYTTSELAKDTVELLDFIGWKGDREINVVGVSMGGMISLELAKLIPSRILSLILTSTKAGNKRFDLPSISKTLKLTKLFLGSLVYTPTPEESIALIVDVLYPPEFLNELDPNSEGGNEKRRVGIERDFLRRSEIGKLQTGRGKAGQMSAVLRHHVTAAELDTISKNIPKIAIITGDKDQLIDPARSQDLHDLLPGSELKIVHGAGHALPSQIALEYNKWIESVIQDAQVKLEAAKTSTP